MSFFDKDIEKMTDEDLGRRVRENQMKRRKYVEENTPLWIKEGAELRTIRESQKISQKELSELIGVCPQTLGRLENGKPIIRRYSVQKSYKTAMELISLRRDVGLKKYES